MTLRDVLFEGAAVAPQLALTFPIVGAIIASRHPGNPLGWIFCVIGLSQGTVELTYDYSLHALLLQPGSLPGGDFIVMGFLVDVDPGLRLVDHLLSSAVP